MSHEPLATIDEAIDAFRKGRMVIIVDDEDRENEGDFVIAADHVTPDAINFMITHGRGLVCLAMAPALIDRLQIPLMVPSQQNRSGFGTGFTLSVEAARGVSTGISAADRAHTIRTLIDPASTPHDIAMPGHVFPLRARENGVLERRGQTEASVDLARLAGLSPAGVICEVMATDGSMMRLPELQTFARAHDLLVISVEDLARWRREREGETGTAGSTESNPLPRVSEYSRSTLPTRHGEFRLRIYRDEQGLEHTLLHVGELADGDDAPLVRLHSECLTGDALGSLRCDCGAQLNESLRRIAEAGRGALVYLRQEGRGIGLGNKIKAYALQDQGVDTVDANHQLGFPADARSYDIAAAMLHDLGVRRVKLLTNNPAKQAGLEAEGLVVEERIALEVGADAANRHYLETKRERMGHLLSIAD